MRVRESKRDRSVSGGEETFQQLTRIFVETVDHAVMRQVACRWPFFRSGQRLE